MRQEDKETKTITFKYDPFGRRVEKRVEEAKDSKTESKTYTYVYDNEDIILEYLVKEENGKKSKTEVTRYVHGPGIDEPLAIERKGEIYFYHADGLGSITALTDERQKVVESYTYSSFGEIKRKGDRVKNAYTYTAREWDEEIDLYYYRARYYDPEAGRFISKDSIGFGGGVNHFAYASNNPNSHVDPYGFKASEFSFQIDTGGSVGYYIIGVGVFDATITELNSRKSCKYTVKCFGIGVGFPEINITSKAVNFTTDTCKECSEFEGLGYIGGYSAVGFVGGVSGGGGVKIPNGPFIAGNLLGLDFGGFRFGVSHSACTFTCYSK